jgi:hypothetical protein
VTVCVVCGRRLTRQGFCPRIPDCNYEARRRLGISERHARRLRAEEWRHLIAARERRAA